MSYFMTVSGCLPATSMPNEVEFIPASQAQSYIADLSAQLADVDVDPVYLVRDRATGTSDDLISPLVSALLEGSSIAALPIIRVIQACISNAVNFRIWYANNDPCAYKLSATQANDLSALLAGLKNHQGVWWHAASAA